MQRSDGGFGLGNERNGISLPIDRRSYLKLAGAAVGSLGLFSGRASAVERHGIQFSKTVDMVRDAGCDPTGREPCDEQIREAADDYTLLKFPDGEYKITEKNVILDKTNLGFVGVGDVKFTVPEWFNEKILVVDRGTGVLFENIDIDLTAYGATPGLHLAAEDDLQIHDVEYIGEGLNPYNDPQECGNNKIEGCHENQGVETALFPIVRSADGTGIVRNVVAHNQGFMGTYTRTGSWIGVSTEGTVRFENCQFDEFSGNGLYCSRTYGVVHIEGGAYRNNDVSQVRLGSTGSSVTNAVIEVDANDTRSPNPWDALNQRGVWFESRKVGGNGPEVRDCEIAITETPNSSGGVVTASTVNDFSVRDTRIGVDVDGVRGIYGSAPSGEGHTAVFQGVSITGSASYSQAIFLRNHPDSVVENCCIQQEGASRDGVRLDSSPGTVVRNSTINVTGREVVERDGWVNTSNISNNGSCPVPDANLPHTLSIEGNDGRYSYTFSVSGDLAKGDTADPNDSLSGNTASGQGGGGGIDSYEFSGEIIDITLNGDATLYLDGEEVSVADVLPHRLSIEGNDGRYSYTFSVSGDLAKGDTADPNDPVSGSTASGQGGDGGIDSYGFSGTIATFDLNGDATAYLDGERLDPTDYPDNILTIGGVNDTVRYEFTATGNVGENSGVEQQWADRIDGTTGSGVVGRGRDSYTFSGALASLNVNGRARVRLNGERIDPANYPDHVLTVEGVNDIVRYEFAATGSVGENSGVEQQWADHISGTTGGGVVGAGRDSYTFSGDIERLVVDSHARIEVDRSAQTISVSNSREYVGYRLAVSGNFSRTNSVVGSDISDGTVSGAVWGGTDTYRYTGEIQELSIDDGASVTVS